MSNENETGKPLRILHLEDSPRDAELIRERLIDAGFSLQMDRASNEQEFTYFLQRGGYDLVLADYLIPSFDAPAAFRLAKSLCPGIPFISVSGAIGEEKAVELLKQGVTDYVPKDRLDKLPLALERALDEIREHKARRLAEEALRESEAKYRRIVDTSIEGIWVLGPDAMTDFVNARIAEILGFSCEEMNGRPMTDFMFEEDAPDHLRRMETRRQGLSENYERRFRRKDGETVWTQASATPVFDAGHNFQGSFVMLTDITERKRAEEKEHLLSAIVQSSDDAIIAKDLDGVILSWNRGAERIYGYSAEEAVGKSISMLVPPELADELAEIMTQLGRGERIEHFTTERMRKDGELISLSLIVSPILSEAGNIVAASTIAHDITNRRLAEKALSKSEAELKDAQRIAHIGSWDWDITSDTITCSEEYYRIHSIDPNLPPPNFREHLKNYTQESAERLAAEVAKTMQSGEPFELELELANPDANRRWIFARGEAKYDADRQIMGLRGTAQNITERKQAEAEILRLNANLEQRVVERTNDLETKRIELTESQVALMNIVEDLNRKAEELGNANAKLQELERLKSMFIASMSHELRTPLNSIIGFSSILFNGWLGPVSPEQKENLATILRSGKHLLNLINDVIDVSKIEAGKIEVIFEKFDLYDLISEAVQYVEKDIREKGLELHLELQHETVCTDRRRLLQCIINLLSNALKFTEQGVITVEVSREIDATKRPFPPEETPVSIAVHDTGIGIAAEDIPKLFQSFVRLDSPIKTTVPGTGLGLYLTRKLVDEVLRGTIRCTSSVGVGSTFTIRIPERIDEEGTGSRG